MIILNYVIDFVFSPARINPGSVKNFPPPFKIPKVVGAFGAAAAEIISAMCDEGDKEQTAERAQSVELDGYHMQPCKSGR